MAPNWWGSWMGLSQTYTAASYSCRVLAEDAALGAGGSLLQIFIADRKEWVWLDVYGSGLITDNFAIKYHWIIIQIVKHNLAITYL